MRRIKYRTIAALMLGVLAITGAPVKSGTDMLTWLVPQTAWAIATEDELEEQERQTEAERQRAEEGQRQEGSPGRSEDPQPRKERPLATPQMIYVQGGTFTNGQGQQVTINSFFVSKYEVTCDEYETYLKSKYSAEMFNYIKSKDKGKGRGDRPVVYVSWEDAVKYCNWRSNKEGLKPFYIINESIYFSRNDVTCDYLADGYRLPTVDEWEYAAKGGNKSKGYAYSGSNSIDDVAWHLGNSGYMAHPVGQLEPNEVGLCDMSGNVSELCWDEYQGGRVYAKGGSWLHKAGDITVNGSLASPGITDCHDWLGFRVVKKAVLAPTIYVNVYK